MRASRAFQTLTGSAAVAALVGLTLAAPAMADRGPIRGEQRHRIQTQDSEHQLDHRRHAARSRFSLQAEQRRDRFDRKAERRRDRFHKSADRKYDRHGDRARYERGLARFYRREARKRANFHERETRKRTRYLRRHGDARDEVYRPPSFGFSADRGFDRRHVHGPGCRH